MSSACTSNEVCHWSMLQYTTVGLLAHQSFPSAIEVPHKKCLSLNSACPVHYTSSEVQYFKRSTMYFVLKYPLKCSEICFEVQRSSYFAVLGLHCRRTWAGTCWQCVLQRPEMTCKRLLRNLSKCAHIRMAISQYQSQFLRLTLRLRVRQQLAPPWPVLLAGAQPDCDCINWNTPAPYTQYSYRTYSTGQF